jgi:hypothetical protein
MQKAPPQYSNTLVKQRETFESWLYECICKELHIWSMNNACATSTVMKSLHRTFLCVMCHQWLHACRYVLVMAYLEAKASRTLNMTRASCQLYKLSLRYEIKGLEELCILRICAVQHKKHFLLSSPNPCKIESPTVRISTAQNERYWLICGSLLQEVRRLWNIN